MENLREGWQSIFACLLRAYVDRIAFLVIWQRREDDRYQLFEFERAPCDRASNRHVLHSVLTV